jgi:hypothetical protein
MNGQQPIDITPIKQHAGEPHLLFHGAQSQSTVNSVHCRQARWKKEYMPT